MRKNAKSPVTQKPWNLVCPACGNTGYFIEVMEEEAHVVNGKRDYIRLLVGIVDHYVCGECAETIELDDDGHQISPRPHPAKRKTALRYH